jgi:hypothetical protein
LLLRFATEAQTEEVGAADASGDTGFIGCPYRYVSAAVAVRELTAQQTKELWFREERHGGRPVLLSVF